MRAQSGRLLCLHGQNATACSKPAADASQPETLTTTRHRLGHHSCRRAPASVHEQRQSQGGWLQGITPATTITAATITATITATAAAAATPRHLEDEHLRVGRLLEPRAARVDRLERLLDEALKYRDGRALLNALRSAARSADALLQLDHVLGLHRAQQLAELPPARQWRRGGKPAISPPDGHRLARGRRPARVAWRLTGRRRRARGRWARERSGGSTPRSCAASG